MENFWDMQMLLDLDIQYNLEFPEPHNSDIHQ